MATSTKSPEVVAKVRRCERTELDIHLCYDTFGDKANPPLVMIMGLNGQMTMWNDELCERLSKHFYVIRFDNRDTGRSTKVEDKPTPSVYALLLPPMLTWWKTPEPYTLNCMADDLWALVDHVVGPGAKAHLLGVSMGGMIAQCATLMRPDRVISLTSMMSTTGAKDLPQPPFWVKWEMTKKPKSLELPDRIDFRVNLCKNVLGYRTYVNEERIRENTKVCVERSPYIYGFGRHMAAILRAPDRGPLWRELGKKAPPTLVMHGELDVLVHPEAGKRTHEVIEGAELQLYGDMAHFMEEHHFDRMVHDVASVARKGHLRVGEADAIAELGARPPVPDVPVAATA